MLQVYAYLLHLLTGVVLLMIFMLLYTKLTPFDELALIRRGDMAAALSLGGAMLGFTLTLASSIMHYSDYIVVVGWSLGAMVVQVAAYACTTRLLPQLNQSVEDNNVAMGALMGSLSLTVGVINAACLS